MNHIDLFSGIGGFALAAKGVWGDEYNNLFFCDNNIFCQEVIRKNFGKESLIYGDIHEIITWLVVKNVVKYILCEHLNRNEQILEIFKRQLLLTESQKKSLYVNIAKKNMKLFYMKRSDVDDTALASVVTKGCEENLPLMQMAESGCEEQVIQTGKTEEVESETCVTMTQQQLNGEEEYLRGIDILAKIVDIYLQKQVNLTPTTLCDGLTTNERDLLFQMALLYALNATIGDIQNDKRPDLVSGGFPCQSFSCAGKRRGTKDDRYLWPEMFAIIRLTKPRFVLAENVRGLLTIEGGMVFEQVCLDLERAGYEVQTFIIPACAINAPHRRDRVWIVANCKCELTRNISTYTTESIGRQSDEDIGQTDSNASDTGNEGLQGGRKTRNEDSNRTEYGNEQFDRCNRSFNRKGWKRNWLEVATRLCGMDARISTGVDRLKLSASKHRVERLKSLGNAIVPPLVIEIMKGIKYAEIQK
jgi:DNA (cytosine-5)-methyltransferase 1